MGKLFLHRNGKLLGDLELEPGVTTLGRKPDNDIILGDRAVSGHHARIHLSHGLATVQDLDSTNGTFVNGKRVSTRPLDDGDVITIGNYRIGFASTQGAVPDTRTPTQILRLDTPGMPPVPVDERATGRIRKWRSAASGRPDPPGERRVVRLRIMSGCNQGRHLDLIAPVTALGEPGRHVVVMIREDPKLLVRVVQAETGPVFVNEQPLGEDARLLRHNDVIRIGEVRMIVVLESSAEELGAGTEQWRLE